ncbi:amylo-alpha-1,6-glucosidase [Polyangium sp. y55x31]|uniref:amylo-alpha-1,6-glucosidase n=1 Tax=Polyangium sp. y55x31 TaxID=3042688 RepID=UPI00248210AA|nr:amylo-alpha-1,6-glucosidase [Polyangium sp. y55x31]MDI1483770.1 amylo-alpha-1,6-glucosidase [Polyangium sp. y55x31]
MSERGGASGGSIWPHVDVRHDLGRALFREWVAGNGAGAYASSTVACMHTRRYHGLLVAALEPPRARHVVLSHVDIAVKSLAPRGAWDLATHQFPGINPERGPFYLKHFDQDPVPRWTYTVAGGELEVLLALVRGENAAVLRYTWRGPQPVVITLRPLLAMRHMHGLMREHGAMEQRVELRAGEMRVRPMRALPKLCFRYEGTFVGSPDWWRRFEYLLERDRGLEFQEDLWTPGVFEIRADGSGAPSFLVVGVEKLPEGKPEDLIAATTAALEAEDPGPEKSTLERKLSVAAELYRADLAPEPTIVAGYPWAEGWGRDSLIALPGLYLATGKIEAAKHVARRIVASMEGGLVPSRRADEDGRPDTASADATLWLFEAARCFADVLGAEDPFLQGELVPAMTAAFEAILRGDAPNGIRVTADGLLAAGKPGDAPTWMNARAFGRPVTPRVGCAIELSALWARGCHTLARLAHASGAGSLADRADIACRRARAAFHARFWCEQTSYPFDVISESQAGEGAFQDASVRPNAILALAIDPACFSPERARATITRARAELVTPAGLRTLAPSDASYCGYYAGNVAERDAAYHQGTAWPWLLGSYARAVRSVLPAEDPLVAEIPDLIAAATDRDLAVGQVPELASGNMPFSPNGGPAQAFSVAELLRALKNVLG